jgi:hypothetical protein
VYKQAPMHTTLFLCLSNQYATTNKQSSSLLDQPRRRFLSFVLLILFVASVLYPFGYCFPSLVWLSSCLVSFCVEAVVLEVGLEGELAPLASLLILVRL